MWVAFGLFVDRKGNYHVFVIEVVRFECDAYSKYYCLALHICGGVRIDVVVNAFYPSFDIFYVLVHSLFVLLIVRHDYAMWTGFAFGAF